MGTVTGKVPNTRNQEEKEFRRGYKNQVKKAQMESFSAKLKAAMLENF